MNEQAASVVIACHTEERWYMLLRAITSALGQTPAAAQVVVAVDHNVRLCNRLRAEVDGIEVVDHRGVPGASGTRNAGAALARAPVVVFLDDDVQARPGWLRELLAPFADPGVVGSGGMTKSAWQCAPPRWFPDEFAWVVGASHVGLPTAAAPVRNVWSENMAVRRAAFEAVSGFRLGFGKLEHISRPEDTDLCIRISVSAPGTRWVYVPIAIADHQVPPERATFGFFLRRCYWEGAGKVELSALLGADRNLGDERSYLMRMLPLAFVHDLVNRDFARALTIVAGTAAAATGAAAAVVRTAQPRFRR
jgi:GT2 family glycosyltransferase